MEDFAVIWILSLTIAAFLGLIPASIAQKKGYNFCLWWLYGWGLFIVAIVHVTLIPDKEEKKLTSNNRNEDNATDISEIEKLKQYKALLDEGILTKDEFEMKKRKILKL